MAIAWHSPKSIRTTLRFGLLTTAIVTVLIGGLGTLFISREVAVHQTQAFLLRTASALALLFQRVNHRFVRPFLVTAGVGHLRLIPLAESGRPLVSLPLPLKQHSINWQILHSGGYQSGVVGNEVFIAYPVTTTQSFNTRITGVHAHKFALLLTRPLPSIVGPVLFVVAAVVITAIIAVVISDRYTAHISKTLDRLVSRANRVASGHLDDHEPSGEPREAEFAALDLAISSMIDSLRAASEIESTYILAISHDLRTPLTSIRGFAEAIIDEAISSPIEAAHTIEREAQRIERLINDLIALARLRANDYALSPQSINLNDLLRHLLEAVSPRAERRSLQVVSSLPADQVIITQDPERLLQLLGNLLDNAIKYANDRVCVDLKTRDGATLVEITDDGPGIPSSTAEQLFHSQLKPTPGRDGAVGSGLGLLIVGRLATLMGIEVRADSPINQAGGTRCEVILADTNSQSMISSSRDTAPATAEPESRPR